MNRTHLIVRIPLALAISLLIWMSACSRNEPPHPQQQQSAMEENMYMTQDNLTPTATIPAIDAAAPEQFEIATFGLG